MQTRTVGEILKRERLKHHFSLEDLSRRTRIRLSYLKALEKNQFDLLPAAIFVKGYIKTYARIFGFDHHPLLALLRRDFKESAKGQLVPREFIKPILKGKRVWTPITFVLVCLVFIFISLFGYVAWQWYNYNKPPLLLISSPAEDALVATRAIVKGQTVPDATVFINDEPTAIQQDGSFQTEINLSHEGISTITIETKDRRGKTNMVQRTVFVKF